LRGVTGVERTFETPLGPIVLVGQPEAFDSAKPLVVAIAGAFAIARGPLFRLAPVLGPEVDVVAGHLPGNHSPTLVTASVGVYAAAYAHVINTVFAGRAVTTCGASIGGLVALGLRSPHVRQSLVIEPPLVMSKLWPMWPTLRERLRLSPGDADVRSFIHNVFGVTETDVEERRYEGALTSLATPTHVQVGDQPLFPKRPFEKLPSLVDEPERALLAAHPHITLSVAPGAGHNVLQQSAPAFVAALQGAVARARGLQI
jgi:pimeloyl-ACP methyl ester carboxylesterase